MDICLQEDKREKKFPFKQVQKIWKIMLANTKLLPKLLRPLTESIIDP